MIELVGAIPSTCAHDDARADNAWQRASNASATQRVLHVINGEYFSGAERVQQLLGKRLAAFGYEPIFACLKKGKFLECSGLSEDRMWLEPMRHRLDLGVVSRLAKRSLEAGVRLLHAHTPRSALIANFVSRKIGVPWIYHVHSPTARDSTHFFRNWINDWVERISLRRASRIITVSKSLRREMLRQGCPRQRLVVIANGVSVQDPIFTVERVEQSQWTLGMVALIRPRKGIEVLLQAFRAVLQRHPTTKLHVIGSFETSEYQTQVLDLTRRLGIDHAVVWKGFTRDVAGALRDLDALVLPSLFGEGMPMVVLEALAVGVPIVATRVEGTPEVIRDGREGYLAEPANALSLAQTIEKMIGDRHAWSRMSRQAWLRHQDAFSDIRMARRVAQTYNEVLLGTNAS